jgi:hypothetical protein
LYASSIIWLYVHGTLPSKDIIHIDGNQDNDSLDNLEEKYTIDLGNINQQTLSEIFDYNKDTGKLIRKVSLGGGHLKGQEAGSLHLKSGYRRVFIQGKSFEEHKLIWELVTGTKPTVEVDHRDTNRSNNKWDNLRLATRNQNQHNASLRSDNTSGHKGIVFHNGCYKAQVNKDNVKYIEYFKDKEEAITWLQNKREELHLDFTNHGLE